MMIEKLTHPINKVLLVEDSSLAQLAAKIVLERANLCVDVASSGAEAIQLLDMNHYDLILMDIGLGDMTGFDVVKHIKNQSGPNQNSNILALTAHNDREYEDQSKEIGMQGYLVKPIDDEKVAAILEK